MGRPDALAGRWRRLRRRRSGEAEGQKAREETGDQSVIGVLMRRESRRDGDAGKGRIVTGVGKMSRASP